MYDVSEGTQFQVSTRKLDIQVEVSSPIQLAIPGECQDSYYLQIGQGYILLQVLYFLWNSSKEYHSILLKLRSWYNNIK
jgi:hypothetical protein